jgi:hypothetical protein
MYGGSGGLCEGDFPRANSGRLPLALRRAVGRVRRRATTPPSPAFTARAVSAGEGGFFYVRVIVYTVGQYIRFVFSSTACE